MLKKIKQNVLSSAKALGVFGVSGKSAWRRSRLLILGYHGVSLEDEHHWDPELFISQDLLWDRLDTIRKNGCTVLPLNEAIEGLYKGNLPRKAVALTFDDGLYDFYRRAVPVLNEFKYPATVYVTTFYTAYNKPVFNVAVDYLLWKGQQYMLNLKAITGTDRTVELGHSTARSQARFDVVDHAVKNDLSAEEKTILLEEICRQLRVDFDRFCQSRVLQLMTSDEIQEVSKMGFDVQLHTHRHRVPNEKDLFIREIADNRKVIEGATSKPAVHFCYPSGEYSERVFPWLVDLGVRSATTCEPALSGQSDNPLSLPRLIDTCSLSTIEFEGWLAGISHFLPQRRHVQ
jgi:peptidoglycan/xylan/chitin deacetylase (PgdA/CDA1 family)